MCGVDRKYLFFRHALKQVPEAIHHDLMRDDQNAILPVLSRNRIDNTPESQNDVTPALAPGRTMIELSQSRANLCLLRVLMPDPILREAVEHAELFFA